MAAEGELIRRVRRRAGLSQAELARRAGTSQAAVARYESGDVSPMVSTLERLLAAAGCQLELTATGQAMPVADWVRSHRDRIIAMAQARGAENVRLFGSVARGEADEHSDIDLLVDFDASAGIWPMFELADELETMLGRHVDVAPVELLAPAAAARALAEAVPL